MTLKIFFLPSLLWIVLYLISLSFGQDQGPKAQCDIFRRHCKTCQDHEELCRLAANCDNSTESLCKVENLQEIIAFCVACSNAQEACNANNTSEKCTPNFSSMFPMPDFPGSCLSDKSPCSKEGRPSCCKGFSCVKDPYGSEYHCQEGNCGRQGDDCKNAGDCCPSYSCTESNKCIVYVNEEAPNSQAPPPPTNQNCIGKNGKCTVDKNGQDNCCRTGYACFCRVSTAPFPFMQTKSCRCEFSREENSPNTTPKN